jgi:hypothetical protein
MSYSALTFNVMIASPGDVGPERAITREILYEWNAIHSTTRKIVLLPVGWESHSSPEMGATPQTIINKQVLARSDLLIGVFWTRIGTATEQHLSGTVEEIEKHISAGRPAMLYFSSQPVAMDAVDLDQLSQLKIFKESCKKRGLFESYDSLGDFKNKLYRHLQLKVNEHEIFWATEKTSSNLAFPVALAEPALSTEAKILLKEACNDFNAQIIHIRFIDGTSIQTNGKNFTLTDNRREIAKWEQALIELYNGGYLIKRDANGEVYEVSNSGYTIADTI